MAVSFEQAVRETLVALHGANHPMFAYWLRGHHEAVAGVNESIRRLELLLGKRLTGLRCLDLGCGTGPAAIALAAHGNLVTAIDSRTDGLGLSLARLRAAEVGVSIEFLQGDACNLPLPDASFDVIWSNQVVEHIRNKDALFQEMARVLHQDGAILLQCPNRLWPIEDHCGLLGVGWLPHDLAARYVVWRRRRRSVTEWDVHPITWPRLRGVIRKSGLSIIASRLDWLLQGRRAKRLWPWVSLGGLLRPQARLILEHFGSGIVAILEHDRSLSARGSLGRPAPPSLDERNGDGQYSRS